MERERLAPPPAYGISRRHDPLLWRQRTRRDRCRPESERRCERLLEAPTIEAGGDLDAFVAERCRPNRRPRNRVRPTRGRPRRGARDLRGCCGWRHVHFTAIPVADLNPSRKEEWDEDAIVRAGRGHLVWLDIAEQGGTLPDDPADCPAAFEAVRAEIVARMEAEQPSTSSIWIRGLDTLDKGDPSPSMGEG